LMLSTIGFLLYNHAADRLSDNDRECTE